MVVAIQTSTNMFKRESTNLRALALESINHGKRSPIYRRGAEKYNS